MAFSLAGAAALAGFASAQQPATAPPITYDVRVQPWPSMPKTPSVTTAPFTPPADANFMPPAPMRPKSPPIDVSRPSSPPIDVSRPVSSSRTLYYRKDTNAPVKPSAAAELTRPVSAAKPQPPMDGGQGSPPTYSDAVGTTKSDKLIPMPEKLFRLDAEPEFQKYINNERAQLKADPNVKPEDKKNLDPVDFPAHLAVPGGAGPYPGRFFAERVECIEPNYVLYRRLLFEDVNSERYGWTLGPLQPFASAYQFCAAVQVLPYKYFQFPCLRHDTSAGRCLPGDPVPSMIYPPGLSVTGALAQAGVTVAAYFIIP